MRHMDMLDCDSLFPLLLEGILYLWAITEIYYRMKHLHTATFNLPYSQQSPYNCLLFHMGDDVQVTMLEIGQTCRYTHTRDSTKCKHIQYIWHGLLWLATSCRVPCFHKIKDVATVICIIPSFALKHFPHFYDVNHHTVGWKVWKLNSTTCSSEILLSFL